MSGDGHRKLSESNNDVKPKTIEPVSKAGCGCENLNFSSLLVPLWPQSRTLIASSSHEGGGAVSMVAREAHYFQFRLVLLPVLARR
jgi:hypothetical protein